ncbi:transmembrane emp24 domain-containing protein p24delta3-like [Vicia villosa]|uniref:transmembrane emp24 domain-containing protein p24delta3-like n=1 Tax=Vicia villosa TaxID=3911 RepID=UPI00273AC2CA|nr:transmembrane emp24 domain-containing protein p24delta3-like [Vicia villosa]
MKLRIGSEITLLVLLLCLTTLFLETQALWMKIPSSGTKCVSEDIQSHVVVLADYYSVVEQGHQVHRISTKVTSPCGNNLHHKENVTHGQFAFTTTESGNYVVCFWLSGNQQEGATPSVNLDWRTGIAAKDWDSVAKKEKIEGVELELLKLKGIVDAIHHYLTYLKDKEAKLREVSEKTNAKVAWFSIMSLGLCISVSALQLWYLNSYFRKKKLI